MSAVKGQNPPAGVSNEPKYRRERQAVPSRREELHQFVRSSMLFRRVKRTMSGFNAHAMRHGSHRKNLADQSKKSRSRSRMFGASTWLWAPVKAALVAALLAFEV